MKFELEEHIGKYPVVRQIGSGATSRIYLARDPFADRDVAIKVFALADDVGAQRTRLLRKAFLAETALAGRLTHPHIVEILDAASDAGQSYLVMEYVPGPTLDAFSDVTNLLPLPKVIEIIFKCIRALDYAFQHGVIHRDIKPGNILMSPAGDIKVSDFGASFQLRPGFDTTQISGIGSPAYMSPEQIRLEQVTHQTDIYSLGVVMYKLLTGRMPYNASNQASLTYEILNIKPVQPTALRPNLPPLLDDIVMRALQKDAAKRYQSWHDFGKDISLAFSSLRLSGDAVSESEKFAQLRGLPFFEDFDDVELWEVVRIGNRKIIEAGTVIIHEGNLGDSFYLLIDGEVGVSLRGKPINAIKPGGCFGEILYFTGRSTRRTTTITALGEITVIEIKTASLRAATDACQVEFNKAFMRVLIDRLSYANQRLVEG